jgi:hypothetical protein
VVDNLAVARDADARSAEIPRKESWLLAPELREPLAECMIQTGSRWAGIITFFAAIGAVGYWLLG